MNEEIRFLSSNDSRLTPIHLRRAIHIAEEVFQTTADPFQIEINDENVQWTIDHIPYCWNLILLNDSCIGSASVLPTTSSSMTAFLDGDLSEASLFEETRKLDGAFELCDCLYLSVVTIERPFQNRGFGLKALVETINRARANLPNAKQLFYWSYSDPGRGLIEKLRVQTAWDIREKPT